MINIFAFFIIIIVITAVVYFTTIDPNQNPLKRALWVFTQLVGGIFVLALIVYLLSR